MNGRHIEMMLDKARLAKKDVASKIFANENFCYASMPYLGDRR